MGYRAIPPQDARPSALTQVRSPWRGHRRYWPVVAAWSVVALTVVSALAFGLVGALLMVPVAGSVCWAARVVSGAVRVDEQRAAQFKAAWLAAEREQGHRLSLTRVITLPEVGRTADVDSGSVAPPELRDALWMRTRSTLRGERQELADRVEVAARRLAQVHVAARSRTAAWSGWRETNEAILRLEGELATVLTMMPVAVQADRWRSGLGLVEWAVSAPAARAMRAWAQVPRDEVLSIARGVRAQCDCPEGHWGFHAIVGHSDRGVLRECGECEPSTRWRETGAAG